MGFCSRKKCKFTKSNYYLLGMILHLINVRKILTNGIYYGVIYTTIDNEGSISHNFRCKDRGFY